MVPRFVLPVTGQLEQEFEFSIRKEGAPRKEIASVVLAAPDFISGMHRAVRWAEKYTEKKLQGNDRAFPAVRYAGEIYLLKEAYPPPGYVFIENNERGQWVSPRVLEAVK